MNSQQINQCRSYLLFFIIQFCPMPYSVLPHLLFINRLSITSLIDMVLFLLLIYPTVFFVFWISNLYTLL